MRQARHCWNHGRSTVPSSTVQAALELELIERLRRKQAEQQQALQELETAIRMGRSR